MSSRNAAEFDVVGASEDAEAINLSKPDNSEYAIGRSRFTWAAWYFLGAPIVGSRMLPISRLKVAVLRLFGASIGSGVYLKPGIRVKFPWYLTVGNYCWIGEDVWIDNLAQVIIGDSVCISQQAYLCTGNHDWTTPNMKLFRRPIVLHDGCWVGARATVCPGVTIGKAAVLAVGSVAAKDIPSHEIWTGNPAAFVRKRIIAVASQGTSA